MRLEVVKGGGSLMGRKGRELVMNERVGGRRSVEKKGGKSWAIRAIGTSRNRWKMARGVGGRLEGLKESGSWMGREGRGLAMNGRVGGCRSVEKKKKSGRDGRGGYSHGCNASWSSGMQRDRLRGASGGTGEQNIPGNGKGGGYQGSGRISDDPKILSHGCNACRTVLPRRGDGRLASIPSNGTTQGNDPRERNPQVGGI